MTPEQIAAIEAQRAEQGLPPRVTDPAALARLAQLLKGAEPKRRVA